MAKLVSEKRNIAAPSSTRTPLSTNEPATTPLVSLLGLVLTVGFLLGAVAMVIMAFQN